MMFDWYLAKRIMLKIGITVIMELIRIVDIRTKEARKWCACEVDR